MVNRKNEYRLVITNAAVSDISQAKSWYDDKQAGLGGKFAHRIFQSIDIIQRHPNAYPNKYKHTREIYVRKFPYVIIYSIEAEVIFILRVFACKQDSKKKYRDTPDSPSMLNEPLEAYGKKKPKR
jgi:toxin ParE1/3/4